MSVDPYDNLVDAVPVFPEPALSTVEIWHRAVHPKPSLTATTKHLRGWSGAAMGLERIGGRVGPQFYRYHDDWDAAEKSMSMVGVDIDAVHFAKPAAPTTSAKPKLCAADASIDSRRAQREIIRREVADVAQAKQPEPAPRDLPVVIPANVKITRAPAFAFDARFHVDPAARISGGFVDEWRRLRGEAA